jgi:ABC-type multidrug transport system ATPase subunit
VAVGIEFLNNSSLILMDEPTTGLDSKSALNVVSLCKVMSAFGKTVIATMH